MKKTTRFIIVSIGTKLPIRSNFYPPIYVKYRPKYFYSKIRVLSNLIYLDKRPLLAPLGSLLIVNFEFY